MTDDVNGRPRKLDLDVARELGALTSQVAALAASVERMHTALDKTRDRALWNHAKISGLIMLGIGLGIEGVKVLL